MNEMKFPQKVMALMLTILFLAGCGAPAATPTLPPANPSPSPTPATLPSPTISAQPTIPTSGSLFKLVKEVQVTPAGNLAGGLFSRIGYVPGRDRMVVAFKAKLSQTQDGCASSWAYTYREYTADMEETDKYGVITCETGPDVGGLFFGNEFYYAAMGHDNAHNVNGWWLAKYDAVTWKISVATFFHPLAPEERISDPMIAVVNGQIDISGKYKELSDIGPGHATHHQFFTPDLQFVSKRVLTDTPHIDLTSLLVVNDVINFISSTDLWGDMILMQYDTSWNYLGTKTLKQHASAPEGAAFDGTRFYVSYIDNSLTTPGKPGEADNIRLAAFDMNWNLLDDIAVTSFVPDDHKAPARPSLTLQNHHIYVCYDQAENVIPNSDQTPETTDVQVYVKVYELIQNP